MRLLALLLIAMTILLTAAEGEKMESKEIRYTSRADETMQPAMFYAPETEKPVPLVVALHTWSGDYRQTYHKACERWCIEKGWAYIHPNFRGPNNRPEACGSELAVKDIISAVEYAKRAAKVDEKRIYLVGTSGGGYGALLMAGRTPETWAGVSAWVGISDLKAWYDECAARGLGYANQVVKSCGGAPGASAKVDAEYRRRSPLTWLANAKVGPLDINAGITDGHTGSVPISHSLLAFNAVAKPRDRIAPADIRHMTEKAEVPPHLREKIDDPSYGSKTPLFRKTSGNVRVTVFKGGHELVAKAAMTWLEKQRKGRKATW